MLKHSRAVSGGTLVANGRRKAKSRTGRKSARGKRKGRKTFASKMANPRRKSAHRKTHAKRNPNGTFASRLKRANPHRKGHARRRRNPEGGPGGINLMHLGAGALGAIAATALTQGVYNAYAPASVKSAIPASAAGAVSPGIVCALAFFAHKKIKGSMGKDIAKYVAIASGFQAVNAVAGAQISTTVQGFLPAATPATTTTPTPDPTQLKGYYNQRGQFVQGAWLPNSGARMNGAWIAPRGALPAPVRGGTAGAFPQKSGLFNVNARR